MDGQDREEQRDAAVLAGLLRAPGTSEVVLSGRCGECGYMTDSSGHEISCE